MSKVHRLRNTDRIFFVTVNLRRRVEPFGLRDYAQLIETLDASRRRLRFLLCG